jgi:hypothetical protein
MQQAPKIYLHSGLVGRFLASLDEKQYYQHYYGGERTATTYYFDPSELTSSVLIEHGRWLLLTEADKWSPEDIADAQACVIVNRFLASLDEKQYYQHYYSGKRTSTTYCFDPTELTSSVLIEHGRWLLLTDATKWSPEDIADAQAYTNRSFNLNDSILERELKQKAGTLSEDPNDTAGTEIMDGESSSVPSLAQLVERMEQSTQ